MAVAATVLAPLTEHLCAGASAMASVHAAVSVNARPCLTARGGEHALRAGGDQVRAAVGAVVSTSTAVVSCAVKVSAALLPAASLIVPPFDTIGDVAAIPSLSASPAWTVWRNTSALVPLPET